MATPGTNVPLPVFTSAGFQVPTEAQILAGVIADMQVAFKGALNLDPNNSESLTTPQGQLAQSLTAIIGAVNSLFLQYVQMVDPAFTFGRMQDAIARIYFLTRQPSTQTTVQCSCVGLPGVIIPVGALAQDGANNLYSCDAGGVIGAGGNVTLPFACLTAGPIAVPVSMTVYQAINGWDGINVISGVLGSNQETPAQFESRRSAAAAANSRGWLPSIVGAVLAAPNVIDCFATENATNAPLTVGGVTLPANSLYVAVLGGVATDIAEAIWRKKAPGCSYYPGNETVTVYDTQSGYAPPYPAYSVTFEVPSDLPVVMQVSMANNSRVPSNALSLIQQAVIGAFAGQDGGGRQKIGATLFSSRFYAGIMSQWSGAQIVSVLVGSQNTPACVFTGSVAGTTLTVTAITSGALAVGQTIKDGSGLLGPGVQILSQLTGSPGSTGTYQLNQTQAASSELMQAILPTLYEIPTNINQVAAIVAADISLVLV
jgi:hypothetical protein